MVAYATDFAEHTATRQSPPARPRLEKTLPAGLDPKRFGYDELTGLLVYKGKLPLTSEMVRELTDAMDLLLL